MVFLHLKFINISRPFLFFFFLVGSIFAISFDKWAPTEPIEPLFGLAWVDRYSVTFSYYYYYYYIIVVSSNNGIHSISFFYFDFIKRIIQNGILKMYFSFQDRSNCTSHPIREHHEGGWLIIMNELFILLEKIHFFNNLNQLLFWNCPLDFHYYNS